MLDGLRKIVGEIAKLEVSEKKRPSKNFQAEMKAMKQLKVSQEIKNCLTN